MFGFFTVLLLTLSTTLSIAVSTQLLGVFLPATVILAHSITISILLFIFRHALYHAWSTTARSLNLKKVDFVLLFVIGIAALNLYQVHFDYSGQLSPTLGTDYITVADQHYPFPYFADEWYAAGFIKQIIATQSLSFANPIDPDTTFINVQFPFHSLLAYFSLLLCLDPVAQYGFLVLGFGCLTVVLLYLFLIGNKVTPFPAGVASLLTLYIPNSGVLPALWALMPFTLGALSFIVGLYFISQKNTRLILLSTVLILFFYPPLGLFYAVALVTFYASKVGSVTHKLQNAGILAGVTLAAGIALTIGYAGAVGSLDSLASFLYSKVFFTTFWHPGALKLLIHLVIPLAALCLVPLGIWATAKRQTWLLTTWGFGMLLWITYSLTETRILIEHERAVILTAYLSILLAGFGFALVSQKLSLFLQNEPLVFRSIQVSTLFIFLLATPFYTSQTAWQKITLRDTTSGNEYAPAAFANQHLTDDDRRIFNHLTDARFLSHPWKGTVIGIATQNEPLTIKTGTIARNPNLYSEFLLADCEGKQRIVDEYDIAYIYLPAFTCEGFDAKEKSAEGFVLYTTTSL